MSSDNQFQPDAFAQSLAETIAWCEPRVDAEDPKWCLRSDELRPEEDYHSADDPTFWNDKATIETLTAKRGSLLNITNVKHPVDLRGGRLLLCFFNYTNHNYLTAEDSNYFIDGFDNPPWDTWVGVLGEALVSWIPPVFQSSVDYAILGEFIGMLMWLDSPIYDDSGVKRNLQSTPKWLYDYSVQHDN